MSSVRNVITEACERANLCNRKQGASAELTEASYLRFCGILREYSDNNYITAYRGEASFNGDSEQIIVGGTDIPCNGNITRINSLFYRADNALDWNEMRFVNLDSFYDAGNNDYCFSWQPKGANLFTLYLKPRFVAQHRQLKLVYNEDMKLGLDDDISLPNVYVELLTRALAYKMSVDRPRASDVKRANLKQELKELEEQIKANSADNKILLRPSTKGVVFNQSAIMSGSFIFGRY